MPPPKTKNQRVYFLCGIICSVGATSSPPPRKTPTDISKPGWQLVGEEYHPLATKDFAPYLQKIIAATPDVVLTGNWGSDLTILVKQAASFGVKVPFGHQFLSDPVAMRELGEAAIGHVTSEVYMLGVDTPP